MEKSILLQTFAVDKNGVVRSVDEVSRGLACECHCPACGDGVLARQGEVREWHFAHASGSDCAGSAETALHMAAKQVIVEAKGIMLPEAKLTITVRSPAGGPLTGIAVRPATWSDFLEVEAEKALGEIRPDIYAVIGGSILLIEIAVTHFIDEAKRAAIIANSLPTLEVDLSGLERATWSWDELRSVVVDGEANKAWIHPLDQAALHGMAIANAQQQIAQTQPKAKPRRRRFKINSHIVDLVTLPFGMALWAPYHPEINEILKDLARRGGGRYKPQFKNWLFAAESDDWLAEALLMLSGASPVEM